MNDYLNWRYATKKFDPFKKISKQDLVELLEVLRMAPSSYGLQPWKFIVIENQELRQQLRKHAWNQPQVTDCSALIVLCSLKEMDENYIKNFVAQIAQARGVTLESLAAYEQMMVDFLKGRSAQDNSYWMKNQVFIALGMLLCACAFKKIDACPMEGFDAKAFDKVLGLDAQGIESVVLCPVGYRAADDKYAALKKVRFQENEVFIKLNHS